MKSDEVISTLNDLIETSKDGEQGFRTCAKDVESTELKQILTECAERCAEAAQELQNHVVQLGGDPERRGSVAGAVHRGWVDVKAGVTGRDDAAVLSECERGEDVAVRRYKEALEEELPDDVRAVVRHQYEGTVRHHNQIRALRNQYAART
ncbi:MAG: PA2169 family four-helix-bundle protein [Burkholderiales bacterium]|nr:PA2169 family four-helix-bundle protein [Burkholderiales bacterium]